jgi:hypothetical protein
MGPGVRRNDDSMERSEAIHLCCLDHGLLRHSAPRNDGEKWADLPDGQISRRFPVQPHLKKYFA